MTEVNLKQRGRRRHKRPVNGRWPLIAICLFAVALLAAGMSAYRTQKTAANLPGPPAEILAGRQIIRQNIRNEFQSSFSPAEETVLEHLPEDKVRVSGWVDVMLPDGLSDRQNFSVVIFRNVAGDWVGEKVTILPQM
ncbi:MAG: hypothetical protein ABI759_03685 [Candidatus Solibacter sp.]